MTMQQYQEGDVADGPNGPLVYRGGAWHPSGPTPASPIIVGTPDPGIALTRMQQQLAIAKAAREAANAPIDTRRAVADAAKAEAEARVAAAKASEQRPPADPAQARRMVDMSNDEVLSAIGRARGRIGGLTTGVAGQVLSHVGGTGARDLAGDIRTVGSRITQDVLSQLRAQSANGSSGFGGLTEQEGALLRDSIASLDQAQSPDQLAASLAAVELHYRRARAILAGENPNEGPVAKRYGIALTPGAPDGTTPGNSRGTTVQADPALRGVNNHIKGMIGQRRQADEIVAYMNSVEPGLGDNRRSDVVAAVNFHNQHPKVPTDIYPVSVENREVPISPTRRRISAIAQTPGGTALAATADALTGFNLHNVSDNPDLFKAGLSALEAQHPVAATVGTLAGGVGAGATLEAGAGRLGVSALARAMLADAGYGAASGVGTGQGVVQGAALGLLGGAAGRIGTRALGNTLTGVRAAPVQDLRTAGVPMTMGQIVGESGPLGRYLKRREDRLTSYAGPGDAITAQRQLGMEAFNRAAFREAVPSVPNPAIREQGVEAAQEAVGQHYDAALRPINVAADFPFVRDLASARAAGSRIPQLGDEFDYTISNGVVPQFGPRMSLDGRGVQASLRNVRRDAAAFAHEPRGAEFGDAARQVEGAIEGLVDRQAPGQIGDLRLANQAFRRLEVIRDAVDRARNGSRSGEPGVFTPSQLADAASRNAKKFGNSQGTTRQPFFDLARAGQQVLPSSIADSGTAGRIAAGDGVIGLAKALLRQVQAVPYAPAFQNGLNTALLDRPAAAVQLGEFVRNQARIAGLLSRPGVLSAAMQPNQ